MERRNLIPDTGTGDAGYNAPNGFIDLSTNGIGNGIPVSADAGTNYGAAVNGVQQPTVGALKEIIQQMALNDIGNANTNLNPNPLYGYGNPGLEFDYSNYDAPKDVPQGQDALAGYFEDMGLMDALYNGAASPKERDEFAQLMTLLRNNREYQMDQNLQQMGEDYRNQQLYGDTLMNLLQETPEGQSVLGQIQSDRPQPSIRERNITGPGQGGFIQK